MMARAMQSSFFIVCFIFTNLLMKLVTILEILPLGPHGYGRSFGISFMPK